MTAAGLKVNVVTHEREDYVNGEILTLDGEGRPVMSIEVIRDDGTDLSVFAPMAKVELG